MILPEDHKTRSKNLRHVERRELAGPVLAIQLTEAAQRESGPELIYPAAVRFKQSNH